MKIFKRALSAELMSSASAIFLIILGIVVAQRAGNIVRQVSKGILPNDAIGTILTFSLVQFMPMMLSLAIFLAVLLTLTRWHRDSEMVIWMNAGLSLRQWVMPIMRFITPIVIIISLFSLVIMPWANDKAENYRAQLKKRDELSSISPGTFKESNNGERIYFIESFDKLGYEVKNIFVQSQQHGKTGIITANRGSRYKAPNGDNFLRMEQGRRYETIPNTLEVTTTEFERYDIRVEIKESTPPTSTAQTKSTQSLITGATTADQAELHWRLAIPISTIVMVLLAIPLSFVDPRAGRSLNIMFAILIFIIYNNMLSIFQAWITQGKISIVVGLWPVHLSFILLGWYLYYRRKYLKPLIPDWFKRRAKRV
ncbi:LPS export ABC transporter permease LptF [Methylophilus sp. TWE2]|uniref:LPS export ABC transporter permease LptF n=1 Tax=Methylophilus sp. TWE2 TaxID=1662285 RepID=UPI0006708102|nr:LPS export ABC transporter permease LptF [Methylophilus sp. TWE2]AKR42312.1 permease [Methylophilus sp. TWE2]